MIYHIDPPLFLVNGSPSKYLIHRKPIKKFMENVAPRKPMAQEGRIHARAQIFHMIGANPYQIIATKSDLLDVSMVFDFPTAEK